MNRLKDLHKFVFAAGFVVASMLFLLVILPGHFATVNSQSGWEPTNNQASLNGERLTYYRGTTAERCQSDCNGNPNCKGFTLIRAGAYNPNDPPMCYLMTAVTQVVTHSCCISGVKRSSDGNSGGGGGSGWEWINNQASLTGTNLTYYRGTTAQQCQADCANNANCKGFTLIRAGAYNPNDPPMCYLASAVTGSTASTCCISGVKKSGGSSGGGGGATEIDWGNNAVSLRGKNGARFAFNCRPNGSGGSVWGTDIYTDDTSICTAAVHAGLITFASGGRVTIEIRAGQQSYAGTSRNGVSSASYGTWHGSFIFVR
jgi:hypothetical protein